MIKYLEKSGRTREEALAAALAELGMSEEEILGSELVELPKSGFLGIGAKPAVIRVSYEAPDEEAAPEAAEEPALPEITCEKGKVYAPIKGNVIPSAKIPDDTFAAGVLGEGVGIEPELGVVYAPFDGEISSTTDTKHAIGISSPDGMELLIHVGVNTVAMEGDGFELFCAEGDTVKAGQKLMTFSIDKIKAAGYSTTTAVLVTNSDDYAGLEIKEGACNPLDCVISIKE